MGKLDKERLGQFSDPKNWADVERGKQFAVQRYKRSSMYRLVAVKEVGAGTMPIRRQQGKKANA